jgi:hypothetical protein
MPRLYPQLLGAQYVLLAPVLREVHEHVTQLLGTVSVTRGKSPLARALASLAGMPRACVDAPCRVDFTEDASTPPGAERWVRDMAGSRFSSRLIPTGPNQLDESFGWYRFRFRIEINAGTVQFALQDMRVLGVPVPRALLPRIVTRESGVDGAYMFAVQAHLPVLGLLVAYEGLLRPI